MAIVPTGAIYKSLVFDGESSRDYGIYITGQAVYNAPDRDVEMISIPGRNGSFALDKGRFQNIEVTYPAGIFADNEADFAQGISDFRNFLCSRNGYVRLTDDYNPDEYRMAVYKSGLDVSPAQLRAGEFQIVFDCKPQRYLTSGEELITIGEWHETETASGEIASFEAEAGDAVKSLVADIEPIQSLNGYDKPWSGGAGANKWDEEWELGGISPSTGANVTDNTTIRSKNYIMVRPNTTYYLKSVSGGTFNYRLYDENKAYISGTYIGANNTLTIPSGASYLRFVMGSAYGTTYNHDIAINYPSSVTTYSPYSNVCPISGHDDVNVSVCGANVWDEETLAGYYDRSSGNYVFSAGQLCCKNLILVLPNTVYYFAKATGTANSEILYYGSDEQYLNNSKYINVVNNTFTTPADCHYISINLGNNYGATYNHDLSINYPSTDHDYHAYNGNTYTTDLSGTRYGGTLDVVSGVLTVDRAMEAVDTSRISNNGTLPYGGLQILYNPLTAKKYGTQAEPYHGLLSNRFNPYNASLEGEVNGRPTNGNIYFNMPSSITTIDLARQWLTDNPTQICYELATPTTVQLTAQEVELLVGLNQVWANSGDVSVEYGTAPNVLVNPTLFESSPMLEVEGYGNIQFNGYGISIVNEEYGTVTLKNRFEFGGNNTVYPMPLSNYMAVGDRISIFEVVARFYIDISKAYKGSMQITSALVTSVSEDCTRTITQVAAATLTDNGYVDVILVVRGIAFPFSSAVNNVRERFFIRPNISLTDSNGATHSMTCTLDIQFYDADYASGTRTNKPVFGAYVSFATADQPYFIGIGEAVCSDVVGQSTKSILGAPTYIDCDLGEAYKIEDDTVISLNQYIDLGSDLPKLAVGSNQITSGNTITDLKVVPRWWKI